MPTKRDDHFPEQRQAEEELRRVWSGVDEFQADFDKRLALCRSQRASRVMLAIRKAHHRWARRGVFRFLGPFLDSIRRNTSYPNHEVVITVAGFFRGEAGAD